RGEHTQVPSHGEGEHDRRAPEHHEDDRIAGNLGKDREHHSCSSGSATTRGSPGAGSDGGGRGRTGAGDAAPPVAVPARAASASAPASGPNDDPWSNGPASVSSAWSRTGTMAFND